MEHLFGIIDSYSRSASSQHTSCTQSLVIRCTFESGTLKKKNEKKSELNPFENTPETNKYNLDEHKCKYNVCECVECQMNTQKKYKTKAKRIHSK